MLIRKINNKVSRLYNYFNAQSKVRNKFKLSIQNFNKKSLILDFSCVLIISTKFKDFINIIRFNKIIV